MKHPNLHQALQEVQGHLRVGNPRWLAIDAVAKKFNLSPRDVEGLTAMLDQVPSPEPTPEPRITTLLVLNPGVGMTIRVVGKGGSIESKGLRCEETENDQEAALHNARVDGLEALILAQAIAGFDFTTPQMREAVQTAVDAIMNQS